jgi:hypothetical protein
MLRVTLRGSSVPAVTLGSGETLLFGRSPVLPADPGAQLRHHALALPNCAPHISLALAEPWLTGADDYPRPPSNREIYERVLAWHGYAWNLSRPQRVDDALRAVARVAFGPHDDPFAVPTGGRVQNVRYAVGRRAAEVRLVPSKTSNRSSGTRAPGSSARAESGTFRSC